MDDADDDYPGPPGSSSAQQRMQYSPYNSPRQQPRRQVLSSQMQAALEMEQELFLRRQLELQRDIEIRRRVLQEQHQQLLTELDHRQHLQQIQQHQPSSPLLGQQRLFELQQQYASPSAHQISLQEEQLFLQQQKQQLLRQQQQLQQQMRTDANSASIGSPSLRGLNIPNIHTAERGPLNPREVAQKRNRQFQDERNLEDEPLAKRANMDPVKRTGQRNQTEQRTEQQVKRAEQQVARTEQQEKPVVKQATIDKQKPINQEKKVVGRRATVGKSAFDDSVRGQKQGAPNKTASPSTEDKTLQLLEAVNQLAKEESHGEGEMLSEDKSEKLLLEDSEHPPENGKASPVSFSRNGEGEDSIEFSQQDIRMASVKDTNETDKDSVMNGEKVQNGDITTRTATETGNRANVLADVIDTGIEATAVDRELAVIIVNIQGSKSTEADANSIIDLESPPLHSQKGEEKSEISMIDMANFKSSLPLLPVEPEFIEDKRDETLVADILCDRLSGEVSTNDASSSSLPQAVSVSPSPQPQSLPGNGMSQRDLKDPLSLSRVKTTAPQQPEYSAPVDTWWPSNNTIRRERRIRGERSDDDDCENENGRSQASMAALQERLESQVEPGVLEKIPHCKIHRMASKHHKGGFAAEPLFCWQVTETYCNDIMVCCSICSTWRHAFCGGHFKRYTIRSNLNSDTAFSPICDRCHEENKLLCGNKKAQARIDRQRTELLRRTLATTSVIRQFSFAKHGGTYKWPLGSVSATHIGGHTRSVHARHERSEKQWSEMAVKLGNGLGYRPKERVKIRTRELERLLISVEDAEGITDRHNMMLFLQNDTMKEHPAGFEVPRRNIFDPEEDEEEEEGKIESRPNEKIDADGGEPKNGQKGLSVGDLCSASAEQRKTYGTNDDNFSLNESVASELVPGSDGSIKSLLSNEQHDENENNEDSRTKARTNKDSESAAFSNDGFVVALPGQECTEGSKEELLPVCAREGCSRKPRFDSLFCSDSCGVSALELDVLRSFEYGSDIHASLLRA